jgi:hypothetical protein
MADENTYKNNLSMDDDDETQNAEAQTDDQNAQQDYEEIDEEPLQTPMERFFYHQRRALEETGRALDALLPPDFRSHSAAASQEFTQGFRVLVDAAIDELKRVSERSDQTQDETADDNDDDDTPSSTGKTKVKINVD